MFIHLHDMYSCVRQAISIFLESNLHFLFKQKVKNKNSSSKEHFSQVYKNYNCTELLIYSQRGYYFNAFKRVTSEIDFNLC